MVKIFHAHKIITLLKINVVQMELIGMVLLVLNLLEH